MFLHSTTISTLLSKLCTVLCFICIKIDSYWKYVALSLFRSYTCFIWHSTYNWSCYANICWTEITEIKSVNFSWLFPVWHTRDRISVISVQLTENKTENTNWNNIFSWHPCSAYHLNIRQGSHIRPNRGSSLKRYQSINILIRQVYHIDSFNSHNV